MAADPSTSNPFDQWRLSLMQEVLPVGLAVVERVRDGGPGRVVEAFTNGSEDPLADLRHEGEPAARDVRDQLDMVSPGLGNPVMSVKVSVDDDIDTDDVDRSDHDNHADLIQTLERIEGRLEQLRRQLPAT